MCLSFYCSSQPPFWFPWLQSLSHVVKHTDADRASFLKHRSNMSCLEHHLLLTIIYRIKFKFLQVAIQDYYNPPPAYSSSLYPTALSHTSPSGYAAIVLCPHVSFRPLWFCSCCSLCPNTIFIIYPAWSCNEEIKIRNKAWSLLSEELTTWWEALISKYISIEVWWVQTY